MDRKVEIVCVKIFAVDFFFFSFRGECFYRIRPLDVGGICSYRSFRWIMGAMGEVRMWGVRVWCVHGEAPMLNDSRSVKIWEYYESVDVSWLELVLIVGYSKIKKFLKIVILREIPQIDLQL